MRHSLFHTICIAVGGKLGGIVQRVGVVKNQLVCIGGCGGAAVQPASTSAAAGRAFEKLCAVSFMEGYSR